MSFAINNNSFTDNFTPYHEENYVGQFIDCQKINNKIILTTNFISAPRIICTKKNDLFVFDLGRDEIKNFLELNFEDPYKTKEELAEPYCRFTKTVIGDYLFNHVNYIENWSKIIISQDGQFEKIDYNLTLYSMELKDSFDIVYNWLKKYKIAVNKLISENKFIPTITGGIDTRTLTFLYKPNIQENNINTFYIKAVKNDGKNRLILGEADLNCALQVAEAIGINNYSEIIPSGYVTVSGKFSESNRGMFGLEPNDQFFVFKIIQHHILKSGISKVLLPMADDEFLMIKQPGKDIFRCLLALLLCPELLTLPCIGTQNIFEKYDNKPYNFYEENKIAIEEAKKIIAYWGENNCKKIDDLKYLK